MIVPKQVRRTQVGFMKKMTRYLWFLLVLQWLMLPSMHIWLHGMYPMISWLRYRKLELDFQVCSAHMQAAPRSRQIYLYNTFLWQPWRSRMKGFLFFAVETTLSSIHCQTFFLEGEVVRCDNTLIHGLYTTLQLDGQGLEKYMTRKLVGEIFG